ncbi:hypothetical protein [Stenotrophomonas maltophilia]|uniref:hypothetical protein n=1 Tax=Stenotrophomonas maltophilia TaxID=40324 RepID=UPI00066BFD80
MGQFGYMQTIKYEVARELLGSRRATLAAQLGRVRAGGDTDGVEAAQIRADLRAIAAAIRQLDIHQESTLDAAIERYRLSSA